MDHALVTR